MLKKSTDRIKDADVKDQIDFIQQEALGNVITLGAIPTATEPLLENDQIGLFSDKLYIRKTGKVYRIDPGLVITIT